MNIDPQSVTAPIPPVANPSVVQGAKKTASPKAKPAKKTASPKAKAKLDPATKITWLVKGNPSKHTAKWVYTMLESMRQAKTVAQYTALVAKSTWAAHGATQSPAACFRWAVSKGYCKLG